MACFNLKNVSVRQCILDLASYIHHLQSEGCLFHDADVGIKTSATFKTKCQAPDFSRELFVINHKILQAGENDFASRKSVHLQMCTY